MGFDVQLIPNAFGGLGVKFRLRDVLERWPHYYRTRNTNYYHGAHQTSTLFTANGQNKHLEAEKEKEDDEPTCSISHGISDSREINDEISFGKIH